MRIKAALLLASGLTAATPALAIPVLFGGANAPGAGGAPLTNAAPGQAITVTGPLLQLRLPDGSTVIAQQGAQFTVSSDVPANIALTAGSLRVNSAGAPITVTRGGVSITSTGGVFLAAAQGQGLSGRVNLGAAQVAAGGQNRTFNAGGGYVAGAGGITGTFTPPVASAPALANPSAQSAPSGFSSATQRSPSGASAGAVIAARAANFPISSNGVVQPASTGGNSNTGSNNTGNSNAGNSNTGNNNSTGNNSTGNSNTGNNNTGNNNTGNNGTAPVYGGTPPVTGTVALTGASTAGRIITYAGDLIGIDTRRDVSVTIGANGELNGYNASASEHPERNTNESLDRASAGGLSIERWSGGVTGGAYYSSAGTARTSQQGLHLAYGAPAATLPAQGLATYGLAAATKPTLGYGGAAPGTMTGTLGILFSTRPKVGVDFSVTMPGDATYNVKTGGGSAVPSYVVDAAQFTNRNFYMQDVPTTGTGLACAGNCTSAIYGILGGTNGATVGVSYEVGPITANDSAGRRNTVTGAAIFTQGSFDASQGGVTTHPAVSSGAMTAPLRSSTNLIGNFYTVPVQDFSSVSVNRATVNAQGEVDTLSSSTALYGRNDNSVAELWGTKYIQIGRWNGGMAKKAGSDYYSPDGWQGMPYVVGLPTSVSSLPTTGIGTYALKGATAPMLTGGDTQPGSFTGSMAVDFSTAGTGTVKVGLDAQVTVNTTGSGAVTYDISTPGGVTTPSSSPVTYSGSIFGFYNVAVPTGGAGVCGGSTCSVALRGMLSGPSGRDAGLGYNIGTGQSQVVGTAAFQRTDDPSLVLKDVGIRGLLMAPGTLVLANSYGVQNLVNNPLVTYTSDGKGVQSIKDTRLFEAVTAQVVDRGTGGGLTWSRWSDGTVSDAFGVVPALGANQGMHQIVGDPGTNIPTTGTANYTMIGSTKPTSNDNSVAPGSVTGSMAVQFGSAAANTGVGLDMQVAIGGHTYNIATTGGIANPGQSQLKLYDSTFGAAYGHPAAINVNAGGIACPASNCKAEVSGFLAGFGGSSAGVGYTISESGSASNAGAVQGTAAFVKAP